MTEALHGGEILSARASNGDLEGWCGICRQPQESSRQIARRRAHATAPVTLHVYYIGHADVIEDVSLVVQDFLGEGGLFHVAVEVYGLEWSFGGCREGTGVFRCEPMRCTLHRYRESIYMGDCGLTREEVVNILEPMSHEYQGNEYDVLRRNCCTFSNEFCVRLGMGEIPLFLHHLSDVGAALSDEHKIVVERLHWLEESAMQKLGWSLKTRGDDVQSSEGQAT